MTKQYFEPRKFELLTRFHILEYIRENGRARQDELSKALGKHPRKIYSLLKKLISIDWVKRKKEPNKNHYAFYYYLTATVEKWRVSRLLNSYLDSRNPYLPKLQRIVKVYTNTPRLKIGGHYKSVPPKELKGFR